MNEFSVSHFITRSFNLLIFLLSYIFQVPPGEYRLSALAATPKGASELLFLPAYVDVAVKSPLLNIEFSQVIRSE